MYLLKLALRPWRLAPMSQAFSAFAVGFLLVLAGFLFWMDRSLKPIVARLQNEQVITAYLDPSIEPKDEPRIVDEIRTNVGAKTMDVKLVTAPAFVEELKEHYPELAKELENLGPETNSLVPRYVSVAGMLPSSALSKVKGIAGVESAESSQDRYGHIVGAFRALRWVARILAMGLCLALFTGLIHLSRTNAFLHRESLALLRLWGAGAWTLRLPTLLSGLWVGITGGLLACTTWATAGTFLAGQVRTLSPLMRDMALPTLGIGFVLLAAGVMIGLLAGALGATTIQAGNER